MVFIPMVWDEAAELRSGIAADHYRGCAVTLSLLASMGADTSGDEAEYAGQCSCSQAGPGSVKKAARTGGGSLPSAAAPVIASTSTEQQ